MTKPPDQVEFLLNRVRGLTVEARVANERANKIDAEFAALRKEHARLLAEVATLRPLAARAHAAEKERLEQERRADRAERNLGALRAAKEVWVVHAGSAENCPVCPVGSPHEHELVGTETERPPIDSAPHFIDAGLAEPLRHIIELIDKAGGPVRLMNAVQLGQMSWAGKMTGAIDWARARLEDLAVKAGATDAEGQLPMEAPPPPAQTYSCIDCDAAFATDEALGAHEREAGHNIPF